MTRIDPTAYPPAVAESLAVLPLAPLGLGTPEHGMKPELAVLDDAAFGRVADRDMAACCRSGLWLAFNFVDESHRISQEIETPTRSYWHGLMHRLELDHPN